VANISILYYAPTITAQPASQIVLVSSNFTLTVTATGTAPLAYQWRKDGGNLTGASGTSYTVTGAQTNDTGAYTVVVTNVAGSKTSAVAIVNVGYAPFIVQQPQPFTNNLGTSNAFDVVVFGSEPLLYQWFKDGAAITDATNSLLPLSNLQSNQVGYYSVSVTNLYGWAASSNALLSIPGVPPPFLWEGLAAYYPLSGNAADQLGNGNTGVLENGAFYTNGIFGEPNSAIYCDGVDAYVLVGKNDAVYPNQILTWSSWFRAEAVGGVVFWDDDSQAGGDRGIALATDGTLVAEQAANVYSTNIVALNSWHQAVFTSDTNGQYLYLDGNLVGSSNTIIPDHAGRSSVSFGAANYLGGAYQDRFEGAISKVRIWSLALSSDEVARLYALEADVPVITSQPQGRIVSQGSTVSFVVAATAQHPLTYQWNMDGVPISTATNAALSIPNVQPSQAGLYMVAISNGLTGVVSAPAALAVVFSSGAGAPGFTSNQFGFGISGPAANTFVVEASTNLQTWLPLSTNIFGLGQFQFLDSGSATNPIRFYRTRY
jgi:hypothetical protein